MYRFFVEEHQIEPTRIHITGNDVNHIKNVLRMKPGEEILVSAQGKQPGASGFHFTVSGTSQRGQNGIYYPEGSGAWRP